MHFVKIQIMGVFTKRTWIFIQISLLTTWLPIIIFLNFNLIIRILTSNKWEGYECLNPQQIRLGYPILALVYWLFQTDMAGSL